MIVLLFCRSVILSLYQSFCHSIILSIVLSFYCSIILFMSTILYSFFHSIHLSFSLRSINLKTSEPFFNIFHIFFWLKIPLYKFLCHMNFFEFQVQFYFTLTEIVILHHICYLNLNLNSGVELESYIFNVQRFWITWKYQGI